MYTGNYDDRRLPGFYTSLYLDEEEKDDSEKAGSTDVSLKEIDDLGLSKRLKVNALVYKTAEMLGIGDLAKEASTLFMVAAESAFDLDGFEEAAEIVYDNTRVDDRDLRFKLTQLCVENYDLLEIRPKTIAVLEKHEPNVWNVTVELMKRWASDVSPRNKLGMGFFRKLEKVVKECNDKKYVQAATCTHHVYQFSNPKKLKLEEDGSLTMVCLNC